MIGTPELKAKKRHGNVEGLLDIVTPDDRLIGVIYCEPKAEAIIIHRFNERPVK